VRNRPPGYPPSAMRNSDNYATYDASELGPVSGKTGHATGIPSDLLPGVCAGLVMAASRRQSRLPSPAGILLLGQWRAGDGRVTGIEPA
jgi:hypothetical protein